MIARLSGWIDRLTLLTISRSAPRDARERRSRSVARGTATAVLARGVASLTGLIIVPLTVRYLGAELYGAWMAISSMVVFFSFTDFGLAASLTNALSAAFGEQDHARARTYVSTSLIALSGTALLLVAIAVTFARPLANLVFPSVAPELREHELIPAIVFAVAIFAFNFPLLVTNRVLAAYQQTSIANLWAIAANIANLVAILIVIWFHGNLPALVLASGAAGMLVSLASTIWVFGWHQRLVRPAVIAIDLAFLRELLSSGWRYFIIAIAVMITFQSDNIVIAHFLGPNQVTPYSVTFRLFAFSTLIQQFAFTSLWPAYAEAAARKDILWIKGIMSKNFKFSLLLAVAILAPLVLFGREIIRVWAGPAAVPPFSFIPWMALWNLMLAHLYVVGCLLEATGHVRRLAIYVSITAVINLALSILFVRKFGATGVIAGTVIAYAICNYPLAVIEGRRLLRKLGEPALVSL